MTALLLALLAQTPQPVRVQGPDGGPPVNVVCVSGCAGGPGGGGQASIAIDGGTYLNQPLPAGSATIGAVNINGTVPVSGTFWQSTQPISGSVSLLAADAGSSPTVDSRLYALDVTGGTTWKPLQFDDSATDGIATQTDGLLDTDAHLRLFNGTTFDRGRSGSLGADGVASVTTGALVAGSYLLGYNGTTWDRVRTDTTAGLWTQLKAAIPVGSNVIGKVGIDQTTPGTTNAVSVTNASLTVAQATASSLNATVTNSTAVGAGNPCQNPHATLSSVAGSTSGTASVQLVALSGSTKIFICSMVIVGTSGTTPTFALRYGTGSACGTGTVTIIGAFTTTANTVYSFNNPFFVTPAGQALCYIQTGTTPISSYAISYVQL